jgi:hypothetical protein
MTTHTYLTPISALLVSFWRKSVFRLRLPPLAQSYRQFDAIITKLRCKQKANYSFIVQQADLSVIELKLYNMHCPRKQYYHFLLFMFFIAVKHAISSFKSSMDIHICNFIHIICDISIFIDVSRALYPKRTGKKGWL